MLKVLCGEKARGTAKVLNMMGGFCVTVSFLFVYLTFFNKLLLTDSKKVIVKMNLR